MACISSTAPIDLTDKGYADDCSLKCQFKYDYSCSPATSISNEGNHLALSYDKVKVSYNNTDLRVQGIRLYSPSLHHFNGVPADGELIIKHMDMGISLLVCIPIKISSSGNKTLEFLIQQAGKRTPNVGEKTVVSTDNFTLNDFIPKKQPFFSYAATLPYSPCNGDHQYVVFMPSSSPATITSKTASLLKKIIMPHDTSIKPTHPYFKNTRGAIYSNPDSDEGDDDIYIECHPTGADGEPIDVPLSGKSAKAASINFDNPIVIIILGILGGILLIIVLSTVLKFLKNRRAASAAAASALQTSADL